MAVTIAGAGLLAFGSPLRALWVAPGAPWWLAFALWASGIVAIFVSARRGGG